MCVTCSADGEDHLDRVEEEEHDEQRHRGSYGQEQSLRGVDGLNTWENARKHRTHTHTVRQKLKPPVQSSSGRMWIILTIW